nr:non-ribosomal peptide synthetase [Aliikangiella marina]
MPRNHKDKKFKSSLSFAQQRLWFLSRLMGANSVYNVSIALRLRGEIEEKLLIRSILMVFKRQESLRTKFIEEDGVAYQVVNQVNEDLKVKEVSDVNELREIWLSEKNFPFDMQHDELARVKVLRQNNAEKGPPCHDFIVMLTMHHSITDAWSMSIFFKELMDNYLSLSSGPEHALPPLEIQYSDYAEWQNQYIAGDYLTKQLRFWRNQLKDLPSSLSLPFDKPRPNKQTFNGAICEVNFGKTLSEKLVGLSLEYNTTPYVTLLSLFATLLYRYSGQADLAIGSPVTNRANKDVENLIGFFVNTLVMRVRIEDGDGFAELIEKTRNVVLESFEHQDIPFEKLVEELSPQRSLSHSPLFQVAFTLQNVPKPAAEATDIQLLPVFCEDDRVDAGSSQMSRFDLTLRLQESDAGFSGDFEFNTDLFEPSTISRMVTHLYKLAEQVVCNLETPVLNLDFLSEAEKQQQLKEWNNTEYPLGQTTHVYELFQERVKLHPDSIAIAYDEQQISYRALNNMSNLLAHQLINQKISCSSRVGIYCERSIEMVLAILATLKAGASYVPLEPELPSKRLRHMIVESNVEVVLSNQESISKFKKIDEREPKVINLADFKQYSASDSIDPVLALSPLTCNYVIYTSGSTGKPKGVMNTSEALINRLSWMQTQYQMTTCDRVLQKTPFSFDVSVWEFLWTLSYGGCLVIAKPAGHKDPTYLNKIVAEKHISIIHFVPSMLQVYLEQATYESVRSLRQVICSGEALSKNLVEKFIGLNTSAKLANLYGPTEAAIDVSAWHCSLDNNLSCVPIGKPIHNIKLYVVDKNLQLIPSGCSGELLIGGVGLAQGYVNQPGLTAEKFIPNHIDDNQQRLYKTGDLVRLLADGNIEYLGRIDHQVKIRGYRIELEEITRVLVKSNRVKTATVNLLELSSEQKYLIAYVVPAAKQLENVGSTGLEIQLEQSLVDELILQVRSNLPDYMMPSGFIGITHLPVSKNGKLNKSELPSYIPSQSNVVKVALESEVEHILANIWRQLLNSEELGKLDNFFDLGGHSLLVTQLISRIRDVFNVEISIAEIFDKQLLVEQATYIEGLLSSDKDKYLTDKVVPARSELPKVLSFAQQRMLFLTEYMGMKNAYNIPVALKVEGSVSEKALINSLSELFDQHHILRSCFQQVGGELIHLLHEVPGITIENVTSTEQLERLYFHEKNYRFDLFKEPLCRVKLVRKVEPKNKEYYLFITMHHSISDGWSIGILINNILKRYQSILSATQEPIEYTELQYTDYAVWQKARLQGDWLQELLVYWSRKLYGMPPCLTLPIEESRALGESFQGGTVKVSIGGKLLKKIKDFTAEHNITNFMLLISVYFVTLSKFSNCNDFAIGTPLAGRIRSELESLIGLFVNSLPIRGQLYPNLSFTKFVKQIRNTTLECFAHQELPFDKIVDQVAGERSSEYSPIYQVMFALQNIPAANENESDIKLVAYPENSEQTFLATDSNVVARHELSLMLLEREHDIVGKLDFDKRLFKKDTVQGLVNSYLYLLEQLVETPDVQLGSIPLLSFGQKLNRSTRFAGNKEIYLEDIGTFSELEPVKDDLGTARLLSGERSTRLTEVVQHHVQITHNCFVVESLNDRYGLELYLEDKHKVLSNENKVKRLRDKIRCGKNISPLPKKVFISKQFPYLRSGLLNTIELLRTFASKPVVGPKLVNPSTELESKLIELWKDKLDLQELGIDCNYFSVGGDSIRAIGLISAAEECGVKFAAKHLFKYPTIRELAQFIESGLEKETVYFKAVEKYELLTQKELNQLKEAYDFHAIDDAYPLSMMQEGMVLHSLRSRGLNLYENIQLYHFKECWNINLFRKTLQFLANKYSNMKSVYCLSLDRPIQLILKDKAPELDVVDLSTLKDSELSPTIEQWMAQQREIGIDVTKGLWRATVFLLPNGEFLFGLFVHHALWDGWSLESFTNEVLKTYRYLLQKGKFIEYEKLPSYNLFIAKEQKAIKSEAHKEFWCKDLATAEIPWWTGLKRATNERIACHISDQTSQKICGLAKGLGVQEKSIWSTVYLTFLGLLNGSDEIAAPIISQGRPEIKGGDKMIGVFLNALPLSINYENRSWKEIIEIVDKKLRSQHEFRHYPIAEIQRATGLDFSAALFTYTNWHVYYEKDQGATSRNKPGNSPIPEKVSAFQSTNYLMDVYVNKNEKTQTFSLSIHADSKVFNQAARERFKNYINNIVEQIVSYTDCVFSKERLLGEEELNQLLVVNNSTQCQENIQDCFYELFEQNAEKNANQIAITCNGINITYAELNSRTNKLANFLVSKGVSYEDKVGICTERSIEMVVSLLAIAKAGGCYIALDPEYPEDRLQYMIETSECKMVLCERHLLEELPLLSTLRTVPVDLAIQDKLFSQFSQENLNLVPSQIKRKLLAYEIYTSGTSGKPKAVQIVHQGLNNYLHHARRNYFDNCNGGVVSTSFNFDATVTSLITPLTLGKTVFLTASHEDRFKSLASLMFDSQSPLVFKLTPAHLEALKHTINSEIKCTLEHCLVIGGEALTSELIDSWRSRFLPNAKFVNEYGPTETVVGSSIFNIDKNSVVNLEASTLPIGYPIQNTEFYIVDNQYEIQPTGTPGELLIGGMGLSRGYLKQGATTALKFIPNRFSAVNGERLYKSGDLVRIIEKNKIEFLGRIDSQIKVRGYRIELSEIEAVIKSHKLVKDVVVVAQVEPSGDQVLIAYVVESTLNTEDATDYSHKIHNQLRKLVQAELPIYMVPSAFLVINDIPLSVNGKVKYEALPSVDFSQRQSNYVAPENEIEAFLCGLWQKLLNLEEVGVADNFWDIGGHSLQALRLSNMIRQEYQIDIPLKVFFEHQTVRELSDYIMIELDSIKLLQSKTSLEGNEDEIDEGTF